MGVCEWGVCEWGICEQAHQYHFPPHIGSRKGGSPGKLSLTPGVMIPTSSFFFMRIHTCLCGFGNEGRKEKGGKKDASLV